MHIIRAAMVLGIVGLATSTYAQERKLSAEFQGCLEKAVTNLEFGRCSGAELKRQEALVAAAWSKASSAMNDQDSHAALLKEQQAWIAYKDQSCKYFDNRLAFGREGEALHFGVCRVGVLMQRVTELNDLIEFLKPR